MSDVHIDYSANFDNIVALDSQEYVHDTLILAGDVTDKLPLLERCLSVLKERFANVVFVPGNHEMWVRSGDHPDDYDSVCKLADIAALCDRLGVIIEPLKVVGNSGGGAGNHGTASGNNAVWVVPLLSWYHGQGHPDTLYGEKPGCEDHTADMWSDFFLSRWPDSVAADIAGYFLNQNAPLLEQDFDAPIITASHFLPRQDLMKPTKGPFTYNKAFDPYPEFNFSGVAGSAVIEKQLRALGSSVHIYGHQHRNKIREYDGVTYVSHCMGYPKERKIGLIASACCKPLLIWSSDQGMVVSE